MITYNALKKNQVTDHPRFTCLILDNGFDGYDHCFF